MPPDKALQLTVPRRSPITLGYTLASPRALRPPGQRGRHLSAWYVGRQGSSMGPRPLAVLAIALASIQLLSCSYLARFALSNETFEAATVWLQFRPVDGNCPSPVRLWFAPSGQLKRRWLMRPSPDWSPAGQGSFEYSQLDCSVRLPLPSQMAVSIASIPSFLVESGLLPQTFPIERLTFRSATHSLDLAGDKLLSKFEARSDHLFVAAVHGAPTA